MKERHGEYIALLVRHRDMLWRMCWSRSGGDSDRCRDLLQEVSMALWENFGKLRADSTMRQEQAWVRWQARSVFYQAGRRKTLSTVPLTDVIENGIAEEGDPQRELLEDLMASLEPDEQRMLRLYLDGYHGSEIGEQMGISCDTYYQRMHRVTRKLKLAALAMLALLFSSAAAIAFVPQWRHFFFGGVEPKGEVADTLQEENVVVPEVTPPADTAVLQRFDAEHPMPKIEVLEPLEPLSMLDLVDDHPQLAPLEKKDSIQVSLKGNRLVITGAAGETVKLFDLNGKLVAMQTAGNICVIDILSPTVFYVSWCRDIYCLQIGNRQPMVVQL